MKRINDIIIPEGITGRNGKVEYYLSNYPQFANQIPNGWVVLNKILTGCGATTFFLELNKPIILCSHRTELLECKAKSNRHKGKVHLFGTTDDKDTNMSLLHQYLDEQRNNPFNGNIYAPKILTTVDSLCHVNAVLQTRGEIGNFAVVSDEMQCLITDSAFKGDVVLNYLEDLKWYENVIFLSATPYLEKYLNQITEFNNAFYQEIHWPEAATIRPNIKPCHVRSLRTSANAIIRNYKQKGYFEEITKAGVIHKASRAVFYFNDITEILEVITDNKLTPEDVNIICSKTNISTLRKLKRKGFTVGHAQSEGDEHKTFTFITKAAFEGVDLYHPDAYTYIFCNPNREHLAMDLSIDLRQILGRQRLESNPFQTYATIFFLLVDTGTLDTEEEFRQYILDKVTFTQHEIDLTNKYTGDMKRRKIEMIRSSHISAKFTNDYLSVRTDPVTGDSYAIDNPLVRLNEIRAWDIKTNDFINRIRLFNVLGEQANLYTDQTSSIYSLVGMFNSSNDFVKNMRAYCACRCPENEAELEGCISIPSKYHYYYRLLGKEGISKCDYQESKIKDVLRCDQDKLRNLIVSTFKPGNEYDKKWIKEKLRELYEQADCNKTPKATDLGNYFEIKDNRYKHSFTILSIK